MIRIATGERLETRIEEATAAEIKALKGWRFDWAAERKKYQTFKLAVEPKYAVPIGFMSIDPRDGYLFVSLIERAGYASGVKEHEGVVQCLMANACAISYKLGNMGAVSFEAKSQLVTYYEEILGAVLIGNSRRMYLETEQANPLMEVWL